MVKTDGHLNIPRDERLCELCRVNGVTDNEDECHMVLKCDNYKHLRQQYIPKYFYKHRSVVKFVLLLQPSNKRLLHRLAVLLLKQLKFVTTLSTFPSKRVCLLNYPLLR